MSVTSILEDVPLLGSMSLNSFGSYGDSIWSPRCQMIGGSRGSATGSHASQKLYQDLMGLRLSISWPQCKRSTYLRNGLPAVMKALIFAAANGGSRRMTSSAITVPLL